MIPRLALVSDWPEARPLPPGVALLAQLGDARLVGAPDTPVRITGKVVLVGFAFYRAGPGPCEAVTQREADAIVGSTGEWAVRNLWGNFLLFWADSEGIYLLRSPMTGTAIFQATRDRSADDPGAPLACAFTDLAMARALGFRLDRLDPAAVDARLRFLSLRSPPCELADVSEVLPGEVARLGAAGRLAASWSPWHFVERPPRSVEPAALRDVVSRTISAWSCRFERIQLELSGGIDSSIVAACLAGRSRPWRGFTLATTDPDGDERPYARAVADRVGVSLGEGFRPPVGDPIAPLPNLRVRPGGFGLLGPSDAVYLEAARAYGAAAILTGTGGDNVFGYMTSTAPILDALRFAGPFAAWRAARDLSRLANDNIWKALGYSARRMFVTPPLWPVDASLLSDRFAGALPRHPWIDTAGRVAPGQQHYALRLLVSQPFVDGFDRALALPMIAPLLSQPIIEFSLRVPSWHWGEGGLNRAFARRAFARDLPRKVIERTSKGRILSAYLPAYEQYRLALRPFLLDGWLAGERLLDLDALDALLSGRERADSTAMARILGFADMERWARAIVAG